ncbi:hypothetical protein HII31_05770 [Pseudocercospora fuligena]|uniref:Uncharacterized protein n=1 Tax=Pseudocercospora fuligena TaxID=685502 RepID=A0A8H6RJC6_9PEZI|nr:hypothetical protein HII31_05770 [Pseudocercospora fuligena]
MATDPLAMNALLEQLDQDLEAGKSYPDQAAQDQFFQQLIADTRLQNRSKSGQGGLHTSKSLLEVVRYTLRGNKKAQYGPGGSDKKESQDALNHFFTIGSDMLKETYLAKLRAAVQKKTDEISKPSVTTTRIGNDPSAPRSTHQSTEGSRIEHGSTLGAWKSSNRPNLSPDRAAAFEPDGFQPTSQNSTRPGKRPGHEPKDPRPAKRVRNEHEPSRVVVLPIPKKSLNVGQSGGLPTKTTRTQHILDAPRFPYGLPTPSLSPPPPPIPQTIIYHQPLLGCISQAEVLTDITSITTAITAFLGTPQPALLGNGTYTPSSPILSCSPASHDSIWEWLIENIFSPDLPSTSPFLGMLSDNSVRRAIEMTERRRVLSADGIVRELVLAQLRDPVFVIGDQSGNEDAWKDICQMAWRLKGKMSVSMENCAVVRDRNSGCTGVALKEEMRDVGEDDEVEKALSLWRPAI